MKKWNKPKLESLGKLQKMTNGGGASNIEGSCSASSGKQRPSGCPL